MGHETESITETHYAKFTDDERANVMEKIDTTEKPLKERLSDEDKIRLVDEILGGVKQQGQCRIRPGGF